MSLPIISITRHVRGVETRAHFVFSRASSGMVCLGCGDWERRDSIAPVSVLDGGEIDPDSDAGAYLCEPCSMRLPALRECVRAEWPSHMTAREIELVWAAVRSEQARESANQAARDRAVATTLDELKQACRAGLEQTGADQGADRIGKVA